MQTENAQSRMEKRKATSEIRYSHIAGWLQHESSVLDLGAGWGFGYQFLREKGIKITSVDLDDERLANMPSDPGVFVINSKIEDFLKQNKERYDAVILAELIEHIPLWRWKVFLSDILRIADRIIITTPFDQDQFAYMSRHLDQYSDPDKHEPYIHKVFGIKAEMFRLLGFQVPRSEIIKVPRKNAGLVASALGKGHSEFLLVEITS